MYRLQRLFITILLSGIVSVQASNDLSRKINNQTERLNEAQKNNNVSAEVDALVKLGRLEITAGNYPLALKHLTKASKLQIDNADQKCDILMLQSRLYLLQENTTKAGELLERVEEMASGSLSDSLMPTVYLLKGEMAYVKGKYSRAYENALKALVFFDELNTTQKQLQTLDLLCRTYLVQGKVKLARDCGKKYLNIARRKKSNLDVARAYGSLAFIYGKMGMRDSSLIFAQTALELSSSMGAVAQSVRTYESLYKLHEQWGLDKEALGYFKRYSALRDSLIGQNKSREIAQLQAVQEVERHKKENELLLEKAELDKSELARKNFQSKVYLVGLGLVILLGGIVVFSLLKARSANKKLMRLTKEIRESRDKIKKTSDRLGQTNKKLVKIQAALISQKDTAERASSAKDVFLSSVSHELRTPLTAILGLTEELIGQAKSPQERENLEIIKFSGENLLALVNDILDFNKIQSGRIELEYISYHLRNNLEKLVKALKPRARQNDVELKFNYSRELPNWFVADPVRIGQVINNLLSNAIKFTHKAAVTLDVAYEGEKNGKQLVRFAVIDEGIGIPDDKLELIFERFTQASVETTRKYGGTGLGLAITKRIVELYGSQVSVKSKVGIGSTFFFTIALEEGRKLEEKPDDDSLIDIPEEVNILLAEDNRVNQKLVVRTFSGMGIDIDVASNGEEALEMITTGEKEYDVVLMDMHMPKMDGMQATQEIRQLGGRYEGMPIIGLSGSTIKEGHELKEMGLSAFLQKPFKKDDLFRLIANQLVAS